MLIIAGFLFVVFLFFLLGPAHGGSITWFINTPSLILILVPLIFFLCVSKSGGIIGGYFRTSFKKNYEYGKAELNCIATAVKHTAKIILAVGAVGFTAGLVVLLGQLGEPSMLGPSLAVALITPLYSVTISFFVFFPTFVWAENKIRLLDL
ncbi:MAG: hypothetical protein FWG32_05705 [Oscillospiraceae bacterium]|nr:hypothetical protein [Oscillospiraceae bacterium]